MSSRYASKRPRRPNRTKSRFRRLRCEFLERRLLLASLPPVPSALSAGGAVATQYDLSPLAFEPNVGQTDERVDFAARGLDYALFLTGSEAVLRLKGSATDVPGDADHGGTDSAPNLPPTQTLVSDLASTTAVVRLHWLDANPAPQAHGVDPLPGTTHYLMGPDPADWKRNVTSYARVQYDQVYPGVDLMYYGNQGELEYDWMVQAGADPGQIAMAFDGVSDLRIDEAGQLILGTAAGDLVQRAPHVYQDVAGVREVIASQYKLLGSDLVGFEIGTYDITLPLVIDPILVYSTYLGGGPDPDVANRGTGNDYAEAIVADNEGNVYVTGVTSSLEFPTFSGYQVTHPAPLAGGDVGFVTKLGPDGTIEYSTYLGRQTVDETENPYTATALAIDAEGRVYVTGDYAEYIVEERDDGFVGKHLVVTSSEFGAYVARLGADGDSLDWMTRFGGEGVTQSFSGIFNRPLGIAVHKDGNAFVTGYTNTVDFVPPSLEAGALQPKNGAASAGPSPSSSPFDAFLLRVSDQGAITYTSYLGGRSNDYGKDIAVDPEGRIVVVGNTISPDFPTTANTLRNVGPDRWDGFVTVFDPALLAIRHSTFIGGTGDDFVEAVAVDSDAEIFLAGRTTSTNLFFGIPEDIRPDNSSVQAKHAGPVTDPAGPDEKYGFDGFVARIFLDDDDGADFGAFTYLGGDGEDQIWGLDVNERGNVVVTGETTSKNFPTSDTLGQVLGAGIDAFVSNLSFDLDSLFFSTRLGGSSTDVGTGVATDEAGFVYVAGWTSNVVCAADVVPTKCSTSQITTIDGDFPTYNAIQDGFAGGTTPVTGVHPKDAFVTKLATRGVLSGLSPNVEAGVKFTEHVGVFVSSRRDAKAEDFKASIDWGDGSPIDHSTEITGENPFFVRGTHTYEDAGAYPINIRVQDKGQVIVDPETGINVYDPQTNSNISRSRGQQAEPALAIEPLEPERLFVAAVDERGRDRVIQQLGGGLFTARSSDSATTWTSQFLADEPCNAADCLPPAIGDPVAAYDRFGNLYLTYLGADRNNVVLAVSEDGGETFKRLLEVKKGDPSPPIPTLDQPTVVTGPGPDGNVAVWLAFQNREQEMVDVYGATVTGAGTDGIEPIKFRGTIPGAGRAADIRVGPDGELLVIWEAPPDANGVKQIFATLDPDGLGPELFETSVLVTTSRLGAQGTLPAIPGGKTSTEANLAWDRSGGRYDGRAYVTYAEVQPVENGPLDYNDVNIYVRHSDDLGQTWSEPLRVNQNIASKSVSRFFPAADVNQANGVLAIGWYDTRDDAGGQVETRYYVAASNDGGETFQSNLAVSDGVSDATVPELNNYGKAFNYGDYSYVAFHPSGVLFAAWADNSGALPENADRPQFEIALAAIGVVNARKTHVRIRSLAIDATEDVPFSGSVATFTHPNPQRERTDFEACIDWGDGQEDCVTPTQPGPPGSAFVVNGTHTFEDEGASMVWVTVYDLASDLETTPISNVSYSRQPDAEGTIAIDPTNQDRVFAAAVIPDRLSQGPGMLASYSSDGGVTWTRRVLGNGSDGLLPAWGDPQATFDTFGNLLLAYLASNREIALVLSEDGGQTFQPVISFGGDTDYPAVATGPGPDGSLWVWTSHEYAGSGDTQKISVQGAPIAGLGASNVGQFMIFTVAPSVEDDKARNFGDIAVGPDGEVVTIYGTNSTDPRSLIAHLDPDGAGPLPFGPPIKVADSEVFPRLLNLIPAQAERGIISGIHLAWDRTGGVYHGRLYAVYTDHDLENEEDTDIYLVFTDDEERRWWSGGRLFETPAELADELDNSAFATQLEPEVHQAFQDEGIALADDAQGEAIELGSLWRITSGRERYLARLNEAENRIEVDLERLRVNHSEPVGSSQFFPNIAVDPTSGVLAVGWHSAGDDPNNLKVHFKVAISSDGGRSFLEPLTVSPGFSKGTKAEMSDGGKRFQFGDYTDISFFDGIVQPVWADNSPELPNASNKSNFDIANARIGIARIAGQLLSLNATTFDAVETKEFTQEVAFFTDPDPDGGKLTDYSAVIDWGDDTPPTPGTIEFDGSEFRVIGTHTYSEKGSFITQVTVRRKFTIAVDAGFVDVQDAPLTPIGQQLRTIEDVPFTEVVAFFTDENTTSEAADFTASIDWGDNTASTPGIIDLVTTSEGANLYSVSATHSYLDEGSFDVLVSISEIDGETVVANSQIIAGDPPIQLIPPQIPTEIIALQGIATGDVQLAEFEVLGVVDSYPGAYTVEIDWDDGLNTVIEDPVFSGNRLTVSASHVFVQGGHKLVTVTLLDDSGGSQSQIVVATVGRDITAKVTPSATGLVYNPATDTYVGSLTVLNPSVGNYSGPFLVSFEDLPQSVTLTNATGVTGNGDPYIFTPQSLLFANGSLDPLILEFKDPDQVGVSYSARVYAGVPDFAPFAAVFAASLQGLAFEANVGQTHEQVDFLARGAEQTIFLTSEEMVIRVHDLPDHDSQDASQPVIHSALRMKWVGANPNAPVVGMDPQPGTSNYLIGDDPNDWRKGILNYANVRYHDLYPGIDLLFRGNQGELEYDWLLDPGANPELIEIELEGADSVVLDEHGRLQIQLGESQLLLHAPLAYQDIDGRRRFVESGYHLQDDDRVGFHLKSYDQSRPLVIDPVLAFSTYLGGNTRDDAYSVAVDAEGNSYVTGQLASADFPVSHILHPEADERVGSNAFITKLAPDGRVIFSTYLGGVRGRETALGVAVDDAGNAYIAGATMSTSFPTTENAFQPEPGGPLGVFGGGGVFIVYADGFITKLDPAGTELLYSSFLGGFSYDAIHGIDVDSNGAAYVTGRTVSRSFPTVRPLQDELAGNGDAFVTKIVPDGSAIDYSTYLGGVAEDTGLDIAVDATNRAIVVGRTASGNFPNTSGFQTQYGGGSDDGFVARIESDGSSLVYSTYLGGGDEDVVWGVTADGAGNAYVTGQTASADYPTSGGLQQDDLPGLDAFLARFDGQGALNFSMYLGGEGDDVGRAVTLDSDGHVIVAGYTNSDDFPVHDPLQSTNHGGLYDGFISALELDGSALFYSTYFGGSRDDVFNDIAADQAGAVVAVGSTHSTDLRTVNAEQQKFASVCQSITGCGNIDISDGMVVKIATRGLGQVHVVNRSIAATEGIPAERIVASFTTTDTHVAADYSATIDWGDGTSSAGTISGGEGSFDVTGTHTYGKYGTYPVLVTVFDPEGNAIAVTGTAGVALDEPSDQVSYHVTIDTSSVEGSAGYLGFQLNPGAVQVAQPVSVNLIDFSSAGATIGATTMSRGAVVGNLPAGVRWDNTFSLNQLTQQIDFGSSLSFVLQISGAALNDPDSSPIGSTFAIQLLEADAVTPLLSNDRSGAVLGIDVLPDGGTRTRSLSAGPGSVARTNVINRASVEDAPLELELTPVQAVEGVEFTAPVARLEDLNPAGDSGEFTAQIQWGDGSVTAGTVVADPAGGYAVTGTHAYAKAGQYELAVTVQSSGGRSATATGGLESLAPFLAARPHTYSGNDFLNLTVGDFNDDDIADLAISNFSGDQLRILIGKGDASFKAPQDYDLTSPGALITDDFNNDGKQDLAVRNSSDSTFNILLGNGDGTFQAALPTGTVGLVSSLAVGDFDQDGNQDLAAGFGCGQFGCTDKAAVVFGNGDGTFGAAIQLDVETGPGAVFIADLNNDDLPDLVVSNGIAGSGTWFLSRGDGTFENGVTDDTGSILGVNDLDEDGNQDLAIGGATDSFLLRRGNGDGSFQDAVEVQAMPGSFIDWNGDGHLDLVAADRGSPFSEPFGHGMITIQLGNGDLTFQARSIFNVPARPQTLSFAHFNQDDVLDLVTIETRAANRVGKFSVVLGQEGGGLLAPIVSPVDTVVEVRNVPSVGTTVAADLNRDGLVDLVSLDRRVQHYEPIYVQLGQGNGRLGPGVRYRAAGRGPGLAELADLNGDSIPDLIVGNRSASGQTPSPSDSPDRIGSSNEPDDIDAQANETGLSSRTPGHFRATGVMGDNPAPPGGSDVDIYRLQLDLGDGVRVVARATDPDGSGPLVRIRDAANRVGRNLSGFPAFDSPKDSEYFVVLSGGSGPYQLDIVVDNLAPDVSVLISQGDGTFGPARDYTVPNSGRRNSEPRGLAIGDVNHDTHPDIVVLSAAFSGVFLGKGDGTFDQPTSRFSTSGDFGAGQVAALADLNADDNLDLVTGREIFLGNGDGTFQRPLELEGNPAASIAVADFNSDGRPDVATSRQNPDLGMLIFLGVGDGTFETPAIYPTEATVRFLNATDFNGDGHIDLAALGGLGGSFLTDGRLGIAVWFNKGDGTFAAPQFFDSSSDDAMSLAVGDFNNDRVPDLVTGNGDQNTVSVILNGQVPKGAIVNNAPLSADGVVIHPLAGKAFTTVVATFTDANLFGMVGDYSAVIQWDDGEESAGTIRVDGEGGFEVLGSHTYAQTGDYSITVSIQDDRGATANATSTAMVGDTDLPLQAAGVDFTTPEDTPFHGVVATFSDDDPASTRFDFQASIDWGDGQQSPGTILEDPQSGFRIVGRHTYARPGQYAVGVDIQDIRGGQASAQSNATVTPVNDPPVFTSVPVTAATEDEHYVYSVTAEDEDDAPTDLQFSSVVLPSWLLLTDNGDGTAELRGLPGNDQVGSHRVVLKVADDEGASTTQEFVVEVANVDRAPVIEDQRFAVDENKPEESLVGTVVAIDVDLGDTLNYTVVGGSGDSTFAIDAAGGALTVADPTLLDFETTLQLDLLVQVEDAAGNAAQATVTIDVRNVNEPPENVLPEEPSTLEDTALVFATATGNAVSVGDVDAGDHPIKVALTATEGTLHLAQTAGLLLLGGQNGSSSVVVYGKIADINAALDGMQFRPVPDFYGEAGLRVTSFDLGHSGRGDARNDSDERVIDVLPVNDAPGFRPIPDIEVVQDTSLVSSRVSLISGGPENESDQVVSLNVRTDNPQLITDLTVAGTGAERLLSFRPAANATGSALITVQAMDDGGTDNGGADTFERSFRVTVVAAEQQLAVVADQYATDEDMTLAVAAPGVLANDDDAGRGPLMAQVAVPPLHGVVSMQEDGSFQYVPDPNYDGADQFTYDAQDASGRLARTNVQIVVRPVNDAPLARDDRARTLVGTPFIADVLANDKDVDGSLDTTTLAIGVAPTMGTARVDEATARIEYLPSPDFTGVDSLRYEICDDEKACSEATLEILVVAFNQPPLAVADSASTSEDQPVSIDVLANDSDPESSPLRITSATHGARGVVVIDSEDRLTYTPEPDFFGTDRFVYQIVDESGAASSGAVTVTVLPINDPPTAIADTYFYRAKSALQVRAPGVLRNDVDADHDVLTSQVVDGPAHGTLQLSSDGSFRYRPEPGFAGVDTFSYRANDGSVDSNVVTVTLRGSTADVTLVLPPDPCSVVTLDEGVSVQEPSPLSLDDQLCTNAALNRPPAFVSDPITSAFEGQFFAYLAITTDPDAGDILAVSAVELPNWLKLVDQGNGTATLFGNPTAGPASPHQVSLRVVDSHGADATQDFTIDVGDESPGDANSSISGYVYADVNNNKIKDAVELGLPNVPITITGPESRTVLTADDGSYRFLNLPSGVYEVTEMQPLAFTDGQATRGTPAIGETAENRFFDLVVGSDTHLIDYNFGELGLRGHLIGKGLFLASSPTASDLVETMMVDGDQWLSFRAPEDGLLTIELPEAEAGGFVELYRGGFEPLVLGRETSLEAMVGEGEVYVLHVAAPSLARVNLNLDTHRAVSASQPSRLDVNGDTIVTPNDALIVINFLNRGLSLHAPQLDTNEDGRVTPIDALMVINYLNSGGTAEGESSAAADHAVWYASAVIDARRLEVMVDPFSRSLSQNRPTDGGASEPNSRDTTPALATLPAAPPVKPHLESVDFVLSSDLELLLDEFVDELLESME